MTEQGKARMGPAHGAGAEFDDWAQEDDESWPDWVPEAARDYIAHIEEGRTIRDIAREARLHPSTVLRRIRRVESSRDDPLVDHALRQLSAGRGAAPSVPAIVPAADIEGRALPLLRRLSESGTILAVAREMENGVILREGPGGQPHRLAVVPRELAEAMALHGWIACQAQQGRIQRYGLTVGGRGVLRRAAAQAALGLAEAPATFKGFEEAVDTRLRHMRSLLAESPLAILARRANAGRAFLDREQVVAGERLREDYEAAMQGGDAVPWDEVLARPAAFAGGTEGGGRRPTAVARVARAMVALGPDLADVALGCCALLEGLEALEKRMGWSQRSGKVVLRIALDRLRRHYLEEEGKGGSMIG